MLSDTKLQVKELAVQRRRDALAEQFRKSRDMMLETGRPAAKR